MHIMHPSGGDKDEASDGDESDSNRKNADRPLEVDGDSPAGGDGKRRRMPPGDRRAMILEQAAEFFADNGPAASTRALAQALGITQALLYRYFSSKEALVRAVYNERFAARWDPHWVAMLHQDGVKLEQRLTDFFLAYADRLSAPDYRLWMRASLEGWSFAAFYHNDLVEHVLAPVTAELRRELGLVGLDVRPAMAGEYEIVFNLHGALTFLRIRRDIYNAPVPADLTPAFALHVRVFLPGALQQLRVLHGVDAPPALTVPPPVP